MEQYREEREVNLGELVVYLLRRWRSILLAGVLCGLLLGGLRAAMFARELGPGGMDSLAEKNQAYEESQAQYEAARESLNRRIKVLTEDIVRQEAHKE